MSFCLYPVQKIWQKERDWKSHIHKTQYFWGLSSIRNMHPFVSILLPARNEAACLPDCVASLLAQDYPADRMEILIGNDDSEDQTGPIAEALAAQDARIRVFHIGHALTELGGKANVLAQLARQARGELLAFTDADMHLPPGWLSGMVAALSPPIGVVTGLTLVGGQGWMARLQACDWLFALSQMYAFSALGIPLTAMGNNMLVRANAYLSVGGYEALPFSLTEDYALFRAVVQKGWRFRQLAGPAALAGVTLPAPTLPALLHQRKRWMRGAFSLPPLPLLWVVLQAAFYPALLLAAGWHLPGALLAWAAKYALQTAWLGAYAFRAGVPKLAAWALLYEPFLLLFTPLSIAFYLFSGPDNWKGRIYPGGKLPPPSQTPLT